ncbi:Uncharacterised protein [Enterobacter cloacae]|uniref:Uncharacterized protein n=1 Tax=Enterobacter cloacae TaxID=550 RepID=A0A144JRC1_ENTCL|nr:Uncharacterised protein [Enterobacter cloacae]
MGDGVGETLRPANDRGAGIGQVIGVAAVAVNGQRTVLTLDHRAVGVHAGGDALGVSDRGEGGSGRRVVAAGGRVGIEDHVTIKAGIARDRTRTGLFHRHVEAGVGAGRQQVGVVAEHAIVAVSQPAEVQRYAGCTEGQQIGKLRLAGIHHGGPGAVDVMLNHQLQGVEQREHRPGSVGVHHDIRAAAAAHREVHLGGIIAQQRQDVAHGADQQEAVIAVLAVGHGCRGAEVQLFDVIAGGERHHRRKGGARQRGVACDVGGGDLQRLAFDLFVNEGVAVGAVAARNGGDRRAVRKADSDGAACFRSPGQDATVGVEGPGRRRWGGRIDDNGRHG